MYIIEKNTYFIYYNTQGSLVSGNFEILLLRNVSLFPVIHQDLHGILNFKNEKR